MARPGREVRRQLADRARWEARLQRQADAAWLAAWSQSEALRETLWRAGIILRAGDVRWTRPEAEIVAAAVERIGERFGASAGRLLAGVTVILRTQVQPWWAPLWRLWNRQPAGTRFGAYENRLKIHLRAGRVSLAAVVHEMGHYVDERHCLSRGYQRYLRREAGQRVETNRYEDLANAFAAAVLDRPLDPARRAYLERLRAKGPTRPES